MTKAEIKEKFAGEGYPIHLVGRHLKITDAMKTYAVDKFTKLTKLAAGRVVDVTITMDIQKLDHKVDFLVDINNVKVLVHGSATDMYAAIDMAIDRLKRKLSRYIHKIHKHHHTSTKEIEMKVNVIPRISFEQEVNDQIEEENLKAQEAQLKPHPIVSRETRVLKTLTQPEAVMHLELAEEHFLIYRSEEDRKLKVLHRRDDDTYGIIELE